MFVGVGHNFKAVVHVRSANFKTREDGSPATKISQRCIWWKQKTSFLTNIAFQKVPLESHSCLPSSTTTTASARSLNKYASRARANAKESASVSTTPIIETIKERNGAEDDYEWTGIDEFSQEGDRVADSPPLRLPSIKSPQRVALVRHGQSTWNAAGRLQGSSDCAILTAKGQDQAARTRKMLEDEEFDCMYRSPLKRVVETADYILQGNPLKKGKDGPRMQDINSLREIDLYSFQGLMKEQGKDLYGEEYQKWQKDPDNFQIDSHFPVRELWYRASLCWQRMLTGLKSSEHTLVVGHNAINQGLINTALGLTPDYFRCMVQNNAAVTVLDLIPSKVEGEPPTAVIERLNSSPESPLKVSSKVWGSTVKGAARLVLVCAASTKEMEEGQVCGCKDDAECSALGKMQAFKVAEMLLDTPIRLLVSGPSTSASQTAATIAEVHTLGDPKNSGKEIRAVVLPELRPWEAGVLEGMQVEDLVREKDSWSSAMLRSVESSEDLWKRADSACKEIKRLMTADDAIENDEEAAGVTVVVGHATELAALISKGLYLGEEGLRMFKVRAGSVTVLDFQDGVENRGALRCSNYETHLGRWSVPITDVDLENDLLQNVDYNGIPIR